MAFIVISSWIPRSYTHVYEIGGKLDGVGLPIEDVRIEDGLYFTVRTRDGRRVEACMTPYGLFSFKSEFGEDELSDGLLSSFSEEIRNLLVEDIFGSIQKVTYQQVKEGIIPLFFHKTVFSRQFHPGNTKAVKSGKYEVYVNDQNIYSADSGLYVCGEPVAADTGATEYFSYIVLTSSYVNHMVEVMSGIYKKILDVEVIIETEEFKAIKNVMVSIGTIRKDCSERYGKLMQAVSNFSHAERLFKSMRLDDAQKQMSSALGIDRGFERLKDDSDYLLPLWSDVLIKNLENLDFMVNARFELQQAIEVRKEEKEMKLLQAIFLVGVIASILTLGAMPGATITLYSPDGVLLAEGSLISFKLEDLASFGVLAIIVSMVFFIAFNYIYFHIGKLMKDKD
ncbi:MAG: hypothetical protein ABIH11_00560 [Candidatus Altiarchaeota archaeon]